MATYTSSDGVVTAVTDDTNAGVLLRVVKAGAKSGTIWRTDVGSGERVKVRSGAPVMLFGASGIGWAYDHEPSPWRTYRYALEVGGVESTSATATFPAPANMTGWLKSARNPSLSRSVTTTPPAPVGRASRSTLTHVPGGLPWVSVAKHEGRSWSLTLYSATEAEADLTMGLVTSGVLLWQPNPLVSTRSWWAVVGDVSEQQIGDRSGAWLVTIALDEVDRPVPTDAPMLMPRWSWHEATAGMTPAQVVAAYPTMWDLMLAGIGK